MDTQPSQNSLARLRVIGSRAASTFPTIINSYNLAKAVSNLPGDIMECGVGQGSQLGAMALASDKVIWAVDSFEGIPLAGKKDDQQPGYGKIQHNVNVPEKELLMTAGKHKGYGRILGYNPLEMVQEHIRQWGLKDKQIIYVKGWFEETVKDIEVEKLALLRLDGDLYSSTITCLEYLYPKLVNDGYLIIDDYALTGCRRACLEYFGNTFSELITRIEGGLGPVYLRNDEKLQSIRRAKAHS